jgi:hypothetical protein
VTRRSPISTSACREQSRMPSSIWTNRWRNMVYPVLSLSCYPASHPGLVEKSISNTRSRIIKFLGALRSAVPRRSKLTIATSTFDCVYCSQSMNFHDKTLTIVITNPEIQYVFDYEAKGKMFLLPIDASGLATVLSRESLYVENSPQISIFLQTT